MFYTQNVSRKSIHLTINNGFSTSDTNLSKKGSHTMDLPWKCPRLVTNSGILCPTNYQHKKWFCYTVTVTYEHNGNETEPFQITMTVI